jgi:23S rRNA pseudouridine2605 synthase
MLERLQKIISRAGVASRRHAEALILAGQVEVNGRVVTELGTKADPDRDSIRVAGRRLKMPMARVFLALHKPDACIAALSDPAGRRTLRDFLAGVAGHVFPVGRLEYHSTGLVLLTSDGDFAARLFRALGRGLAQTYRIKVKQPLSPQELQTIGRAIGHIQPSRQGPNPWYQVRLAAAREDRLRRTLVEMGHPVEKLQRIAIGRIELGDLPPGRWRALQASEIAALEQDVARATEAGAVPKSEKSSAPAVHRGAKARRRHGPVAGANRSGKGRQ